MKRLINRFKTFDIKRMIKMINVIKKRSNHSFLWIAFDIFRCAIKFGSGYMDYYLFYFEELSDQEKATYINIKVNTKYIRDCNNPDYYHVLNDKTEFLKCYKDYIKRDSIDVREVSYDKYLEFVTKHNEFMAKPIDGFCGYGIELINTNGQDLKELYDSFVRKEQFLLEERIKQNEELNILYPNAVNTIRVVTLNKNDDVKILFTCIRIGNKGRVVDNFNNGGMIAPIDEEGYISKVALDKDNVAYEYHPMTNTKIVGFKIPEFDSVIELCKKLALVTPEIGLSGWDIAIADSGIDVVEGNEVPGYDIYQSKEHIAPSRCGIKERFDNAIYPELKDRKVFAKGYDYKKLIWILFFGLIIDIGLAFIDLNSCFFITSLLSYLFLYKNIDKRPLYKTVIIAALLGVLVCGFEFILTCFVYKEVVGQSIFLVFKESLPEVVLYLLWVIIKTVLSVILLNYFLLPLLDKLVESLNPKIGSIMTILIGLLFVMFLTIVLSPILYVIQYLK